MKKEINKADSRGCFDYGWLKTKHSFSFANWYNPNRMGFGKLRVLNDDIVAPSQGFSTHAHNNMEIVSIPLSGELAHKDSGGHEEVIRPGEIQVMSAGMGILHSEYNYSSKDAVNFLQIWILPDKNGHEPRYDKRYFNQSGRKNRLQTIITPNKAENELWLNQNAYLSLADIDKDKLVDYSLNFDGNGVYMFILDGEIEAAGEKMNKRDGLGVWDIQDLNIKATLNSRILLIEVPMS
ncbi:pirin family protein [Bacteroidota bacterium]